MDLDLTKKHAIVTGGASGIGEAIVRGLIAEGAHVTILDRDSGQGQALQQELGESCAFFIDIDLVNEHDCSVAVNHAVDRFCPLDILVNNAGFNDGVGLDSSVEDFRRSLERNLVQVFTMTHLCVTYLKKNRGAIVNVSSKVSATGQGSASGYGASKGGMNSLTREWALELASYGVRVNSVIPAEVWTPQYETWIQGVENPEETLQSIRNNIPLERRMTTAAEVADTVVFLASARASHTTGQLLFVDGGYVVLDNTGIPLKDE